MLNSDCYLILRLRATFIAGLFFFLLFAHLQAQAATVEYDLTIAQQEVNISGKTARGMTINGRIPGPTLYFTVGSQLRAAGSEPRCSTSPRRRRR